MHNVLARQNTAECRQTGVVRINGLLQTDERTTFSEVARQLCEQFGEKYHRTAGYDEHLTLFRNLLRRLHT